MKVTWEEIDIRAGRVTKNERHKQRQMIGFITASPTRYTLNSLSDGMVIAYGTKIAVAEALNRTGDIPAELEA